MKASRPSKLLLYLTSMVAGFSHPSTLHVEEATPQAARFDWLGEESHTYFLQYSLDLQTWFYLPRVDYGENHPALDISVETEASNPRLFLRLISTAQATSDPFVDDFDQDGLSNYAEVAFYNTNPLQWDTDGDQLSDGFEVSNLLDPHDDGFWNPVNGSQGDPDGDGVTNLQQQETNISVSNLSPEEMGQYSDTDLRQPDSLDFVLGLRALTFVSPDEFPDYPLEPNETFDLRWEVIDTLGNDLSLEYYESVTEDNLGPYDPNPFFTSLESLMKNNRPDWPFYEQLDDTIPPRASSFAVFPSIFRAHNGGTGSIVARQNFQARLRRRDGTPAGSFTERVYTIKTEMTPAGSGMSFIAISDLEADENSDTVTPVDLPDLPAPGEEGDEEGEDKVAHIQHTRFSFITPEPGFPFLVASEMTEDPVTRRNPRTSSAGVDIYSANMVNRDKDGSQQKRWIMAPIPRQEQTGTDTLLLTTVRSTKQGIDPSLTCEVAAPVPDTLAPNLNVSPYPEHHNLFEIEWTGTKKGEAPVKLNVGGPNAGDLETDCMVKSMEPHDVTIAIHPIQYQTPAGALPVEKLPTAKEFEAFFDRVFLRQINTKLEVTLHPAVRVMWDFGIDPAFSKKWHTDLNDLHREMAHVNQRPPTDGDRFYDYLKSERAAILEAVPLNHRNQKNIDVYILLGPISMAGILGQPGVDENGVFTRDPYRAKGKLGSIPSDVVRHLKDITMIGPQSIKTKLPEAMRVSPHAESLAMQRFLSVLAHEIDHIIVAEEHIDEAGGMAKFAHISSRLLVSGGKARCSLNQPDIELVKAEWDQAEQRLIRAKAAPNLRFD